MLTCRNLTMERSRSRSRTRRHRLSGAGSRGSHRHHKGDRSRSTSKTRVASKRKSDRHRGISNSPKRRRSDGERGLNWCCTLKYFFTLAINRTIHLFVSFNKEVRVAFCNHRLQNAVFFFVSMSAVIVSCKY